MNIPTNIRVTVHLPLVVQRVARLSLDSAREYIRNGYVKVAGVVVKDTDVSLGAGRHTIAVLFCGEWTEYCAVLGEPKYSEADLSRLLEFMAATFRDDKDVVDIGPLTLRIDRQDNIITACVHEGDLPNGSDVSPIMMDTGQVYTSCMSAVDG